MEILRALKIAVREWGNIRVSLEMFGDIEDFNTKHYLNNKLTLLPGGLTLARKLIEMEGKLPTYGYLTQEAAYVFSTLASRAVERLGLRGNLAHTFGSGYSWVRTGWFDPNDIDREHVIKQLFFFKIFYPIGGYFYWDFNSPVVKTKLQVVLLKFTTWQNNPGSYLQDVEDCKEQLEPLWRGLSLSLGFPVADGSRGYQTLKDIESQIYGDSAVSLWGVP
ncbi:MAG: hypothetical protein ACREOW_09755 [Thermodesulfobacteriota bacterium]